MKKTYLIKYKLAGSDANLKEAIKTAGVWMSYFNDFYIIQSTLPITHWQTLLSSHIDQGTDRLLIIEINIKDYQGWMPQKAWEWIRTKKNLT